MKQGLPGLWLRCHRHREGNRVDAALVLELPVAAGAWDLGVKAALRTRGGRVLGWTSRKAGSPSCRAARWPPAPRGFQVGDRLAFASDLEGRRAGAIGGVQVTWKPSLAAVGCGAVWVGQLDGFELAGYEQVDAQGERAVVGGEVGEGPPHPGYGEGQLGGGSLVKDPQGEVVGWPGWSRVTARRGCSRRRRRLGRLAQPYAHDGLAALHGWHPFVPTCTCSRPSSELCRARPQVEAA